MSDHGVAPIPVIPAHAPLPPTKDRTEQHARVDTVPRAHKSTAILTLKHNFLASGRGVRLGTVSRSDQIARLREAECGFCCNGLWEFDLIGVSASSSVYLVLSVYLGASAQTLHSDAVYWRVVVRF